MAEGGVDIEMDPFDDGWADARDDTDETDPTDYSRRIAPLDPDPPTVTVGTTNDTNKNRMNTSGDELILDEYIISKRKEKLKKWLKVDINMAAGEASEELLLQSTFSKKNGIPDGGMEYKGVKVLVRDRGGGVRLSTNKANKTIIDEFKDLGERVVIENSEGIADPTTSQGVVDDITSRTNSVINDRIEERKKELIEQAEKLSLPEQEIREISGVTNPKGTDEVMTESLERQIKHYRLEALNGTDPFKKQWYNDAKKLAELVVDSIRISNGERPKYEEAMSILGNA